MEAREIYIFSLVVYGSTKFLFNFCLPEAKVTPFQPRLSDFDKDDLNLHLPLKKIVKPKSSYFDFPTYKKNLSLLYSSKVVLSSFSNMVKGIGAIRF